MAEVLSAEGGRAAAVSFGEDVAAENSGVSGRQFRLRLVWLMSFPAWWSPPYLSPKVLLLTGDN